MPTDVSRPIWVCDICGTSFDTDLAAAQRCEDAGLPVTLPDGALLLVHSEYTPKGFRLATLHPAARIGTSASRWRDGAGHLARYEVEGEMYDGRRRVRDAASIWPHSPGILQVPRNDRARSLAHQRAGGSAGVSAWPLTQTGLGSGCELIDDLRHGAGPPRLAGPVTPEVAAVIGMLHATTERASRHRWHEISSGLSTVAAENTSRRDGLAPGVYDPVRAAWWLAQTPAGGLLDEIEDRQQRWIQGANITAPLPRLRSALRAAGGHTMSASKLSKPQRAIVAATGVEWPPRTSADAYLALVLSSCLEVTMTDTTTERGLPGRGLFGSVPILAAVTSLKGGVGKTTTAGALGLALACAGQHVVIVDLNLPNPGQHTLWGLGLVRTDETAKLVLPQRVAAPAGTLSVFSHGQLAPPEEPAAASIDIGRTAEWLSFLAGTLDLRGVTAVVLDLPPGWDEVHRQVFDPYLLPLTACVHVTTGHPLAAANETLPGPDTRGPSAPGLPRWLLENLSRARGVVTDGTGRVAEIRLHGTSPDLVPAIAARAGVTFGGSLPWEPDPRRLAQAPELVDLAGAIAGTSRT